MQYSLRFLDKKDHSVNSGISGSPLDIIVENAGVLPAMGAKILVSAKYTSDEGCSGHYQVVEVNHVLKSTANVGRFTDNGILVVAKRK